MAERVPLRLMVHYQVARRPLVQLTEALQDGTRRIGAGTRAIDTDAGGADLELFDPATGQPTGERVPLDRVLSILYSLTKR